jgi:hypothetical protein
MVQQISRREAPSFESSSQANLRHQLAELVTEVKEEAKEGIF